MACQWGKNSWPCLGCIGMRVVRARSWREFQNVHVTARISTPCHSIVAPNLRIVYVFTKVARQFRRDKSWHLRTFFEHFKILATRWHALFHLTCIPTHLHAHSLTNSSLTGRQIACHGVNRLSCQCEACLRKAAGVSAFTSHRLHRLRYLQCRASQQCLVGSWRTHSPLYWELWTYAAWDQCEAIAQRNGRQAAWSASSDYPRCFFGTTIYVTRFSLSRTPCSIAQRARVAQSIASVSHNITRQNVNWSSRNLVAYVVIVYMAIGAL